ncbi:HS12A-like protein, partial [Mya arenaria]
MTCVDHQQYEIGLTCVDHKHCEIGLTCVDHQHCQKGLTCFDHQQCEIGLTCVDNKRCEIGLTCVDNKRCEIGLTCVDHKQWEIGLTCVDHKQWEIGLKCVHHKQGEIGLTCVDHKQCEIGLTCVDLSSVHTNTEFCFIFLLHPGQQILVRIKVCVKPELKVAGHIQAKLLVQHLSLVGKAVSFIKTCKVMASKYLLVASIDFGTTFSGWAFSFKHEFERDPLKVFAKQWTGEHVSLKAPTCALIRPDGRSMEAFGYEAENRYAELAIENCHHSWFYFKRFKMLLDTVIEDALGKKLTAKTVFSLCGTVDITVHEVLANGGLRELHKASGGAWGGTKVDEAYEKFLDEVTGVYKESVSFIGDKLRVEAKIAMKFFDIPIDSIIAHVSSLIQKPTVSGCSVIVMVGGFSESTLLQDRIRSKFSTMDVITPNEAGTVVLKGAVIFGHNPGAIAQRVLKITYGQEITHAFKEECLREHPEADRERDDNGEMRCFNIIDIHARAGQAVTDGQEQPEQVYTPLYDDQAELECSILTSEIDNPKYVTDCHEIGKWCFPIPDTSLGRSREFGVTFMFGGTEVVVKVVDKVSKVEKKIHLDC